MVVVEESSKCVGQHALQVAKGRSDCKRSGCLWIASYRVCQCGLYAGVGHDLATAHCHTRCAESVSRICAFSGEAGSVNDS